MFCTTQHFLLNGVAPTFVHAMADETERMADSGDYSSEINGVDFFSLLPTELILHISLFLLPSDVTRCLFVCHSWCDRLRELQPYWLAACTTIGLSGSMIKKFSPLHKTSRELFLAVQKYLQDLSAPPLSTLNLTRGYPFDVRYSYQYARHGCIIGTLYCDFQPREMVVEYVKQGTWNRTHTLQFSFEKRPENRIIWGHLLCGGEMYVCATASGKWSVYDISTRSTTHQPLLPLITWTGNTLYDVEVRLSCCETCGLIVSANLISFHNTHDQSYWNLRFLKLTTHPSLNPPTHIIRFKFNHRNSDIIGRRVPHGKKKVCLVSKTSPPSEGETCSEHLVILQWSNSISSLLLSIKNGSLVLLKAPHFTCTIPCNDIDNALYNSGGLNTEFVISTDYKMIGLIFQSQFHVWDLWNGQRLSCVYLPIHEPFAQLKLVAVGGFITVLGLQYNTTLLLLVTRTGQVVKKCKGFAQQYSHMVPPYTEILCVNEEAWLSDISMETKQYRSVTFWNKTNRSLEAVVLGEGPVANDNSSLTDMPKRKSWWKVWK